MRLLTRFRLIFSALLIASLVTTTPTPGQAPRREATATKSGSDVIRTEARGDTIRVATYNGSLYGKRAGQVLERLSDGKDQQAEKIAAIIQTVRPDILILNEIDFDTQSKTARTLNELFFAKGNGNRRAMRYEYVQAFPSNTGVDSGLDIDGNGRRHEPGDAWGYGVYPGQYSMAVFSRYEIQADQIRTFQKLRWCEMPDALQPADPMTKRPYYDDEVWPRLRLSSKNHIDVPINVDGRILHALASHPTPPVFDGPADHNGCRNHDEIRFWSEYIGGQDEGWIKGDDGTSGGLADEAAFVIFGDLNADPELGDGRREAITGLLSHPRTIDPRPQPSGASGDANPQRPHSPYATADFGRNGRLRVDYVLPSSQLSIRDAGVFWPASPTDAAGTEAAELARQKRNWMTASDHRLVWVDLDWP